MNQFDAKINQLVNQNTTGKNKIFVRTFVATQSAAIIGKHGRLFGLIDIESAHPATTELINIIVEEIQNNFYFPKKTDSDRPTTPTEQFENSLKAANVAIAGFIENKKISLDLNKINIIIGLSVDKDLHFTTIGTVGALLFFYVSKTNYRIINIVDSTSNVDTPPNPLKLFSQIISGKMRPRDILLISTANVFDYFSLEKIKNIITENFPDKGVRQLNRLLEEMNSREGFGALTVELERKLIAAAAPKETLANFNYTKAASQDSIKELMKTERDTAMLLTPSVLPEIKKYASSLQAAAQSYFKKIKTSGGNLYLKPQVMVRRPVIKQSNNQKSQPSPQPRSLPVMPGVDRLTAHLKKIWFYGLKKISRAGSQLTNNSLLKKITANLTSKFGHLPKSSQNILLVSIVLGVILTISITWLVINNAHAKKVEQTSQAIIAVQNKVNEAQASLIFRDENLARDLLIKSREQITGLKTYSPEQTNLVQIVLADIEKQLVGLRHLTTVDNPIQITNFQNLDSQAALANFIVLRRQTAYTENQTTGAIYKTNVNTRILSAVAPAASNPGTLAKGVTLNDNELLFFNQENKAFALDPNTDALQPLAFTWDTADKITDATAYNNRLYLLNAAANQIFRYTRIDGGLSAGVPWLTDANVSLQDVVSIVVDGSVYALKSTGDILRLQNGKATDFHVSAIDPPFKSPTKIKTFDSSKFLYILDPASKRLVVLDKQGNLIKQYYSEKFDNLKDFIVVESAKKLYLFSGSIIYGIPAEHL